MFPLAILEKAQIAWGLPLDDQPHETQLRQLMAEVSRVSEQWGETALREQEDVEHIALAVSNSIELIGRVLIEVLHYLHRLHEPEHYVGEAQRLHEWLSDAALHLVGDHPPGASFYGGEKATFWREGLRCSFDVVWTLEGDTPETRIRLAHNTALNMPVVAQKNALLSRQIKLIFIKEDTSSHQKEDTPPRQRMDVDIGFGGERTRLKLGRLVKPLLTPYAPKRLYLPTGALSKKDIQTSVVDTYALLCVYLVQAGFVRLDDDQSVRDFLLSYVQTYKHAKHLGVSLVLGEILAPRKVGNARVLKRLSSEERQHLPPRYAWPDDYRAFRKFVGKTIGGSVATKHRSERPYEIHDPTSHTTHYMIPAVAELLGIPRTTFYRHVRHGKVRTEEVSRDGKQYRIIPEAEIDRLKREQEQNQKQQRLIEKYADERRIERKSGQRQEQRLRKKGLETEKIRQEMEHARGRLRTSEHDATKPQRRKGKTVGLSKETISLEDQIAEWEARLAKAEPGSDEWIDIWDALQRLRQCQ